MAKKYKKKELTQEQIDKSKARRSELVILSKAMKIAIEEGKIKAENVNAALVIYYKLKDDKIKELHTFSDWRKKGFKVKKGSKSYPVWSAPKRYIKDNPEASQSSEAIEELKSFKICSLFSNEQVEEIKNKGNEQ